MLMRRVQEKESSVQSSQEGRGMGSGAQMGEGKARALDKRRAVSYNVTLKPFSHVCCGVKVYSDGHIDINHLYPEN